jgi:tRNA(Ile2)-agmatinylcytidine synthase
MVEGEGRHLYISLDVAGSLVPSAVYEPAGDLLRMARMLMRGDKVRLFGGVRRATSKHPAILNIEKIEVVSVQPKVRYANPACEKCGKATKSEGTGKGFQCRTCGAKAVGKMKEITVVPRDIHVGIYLPSPGAQRPLTKQLIRYGKEIHSSHPIVEGWIQPERLRNLQLPTC